MLYIEDFLELIEPFPQEIRERLIEMREIDLQIQNETDKLDDRIQVFFQQCKRQKSDWKNENYEQIRKEYLKLLENADDKVQIANQLYDLIEKYLKKLDQELQKFKLELEADHAGITSKLEQVISSTTNDTSADASNMVMDNSDFTLNSSSNNDLMMMLMQQSNATEAALMYASNQNGVNLINNNALSTNLSNHKRKHSNFNEKIANFSHLNNDDNSNSSWNTKLEQANYQSNNSNATFHFSNKKTSSANLAYQNVNSNTTICNNNNNKKLFTKSSGASSNSVAALTSLSSTSSATSRNQINLENSLLNLIRTNNLDATNRRASTSKSKSQIKQEKHIKNIKKSLIKNEYDYDDEYETNIKSEYDYAINELGINAPDDVYEAASETATSENDNAASGTRNQDDDYESDSSGGVDNYADNLDNEDTTSDDNFDGKLKFNKRNQSAHNNHRHFKDEWNSSEDTNERYCICKDISYGDMIMCDNQRCDTQWFHFVCVGLNSAPKGKWFCPRCVESKKKKKEKHLNSILNAANAANTLGNVTTVNATKSSYQTDFMHQQSSTNPFLSANSSFSTNFNEKKF